ncbi:MAG: NUDIX hydrolase [Alphaproteobacteria bacterium]
MSGGASLPVYKVGIVVVRPGSGAPEVLLVQPEPDPAKSNYNPREEPPFVLPRGSRRAAVDGFFEDIRSDADAQRLRRHTLEDCTETILREAEEEAGVPRVLLEAGGLRELGVRDYTSSPEKPPVKVQWYVFPVSAEVAAQFDPKPPEAREVRWVTLDAMRELARQKKARPGYVAVVEEALGLLAREDKQ